MVCQLTLFILQCHSQRCCQLLLDHHHPRHGLQHYQNYTVEVSRRCYPDHWSLHRWKHHSQCPKLLVKPPQCPVVVHLLTGRKARLLTATAANMICTVSAACMAYLPRENTWGRLVCFWLVNTQSVGFTVSLTTISSNMAGYTHRSLASALVL